MQKKIGRGGTCTHLECTLKRPRSLGLLLAVRHMQQEQASRPARHQANITRSPGPPSIIEAAGPQRCISTAWNRHVSSRKYKHRWRQQDSTEARIERLKQPHLVSAENRLEQRCEGNPWTVPHSTELDTNLHNRGRPSRFNHAQVQVSRISKSED